MLFHGVVSDLLFTWQEMTEEQKEGAFSNFAISKGTVQLLQGKFLGLMWLQKVKFRSSVLCFSGQHIKSLSCEMCSVCACASTDAIQKAHGLPALKMSLNVDIAVCSTARFSLYSRILNDIRSKKQILCDRFSIRSFFRVKKKQLYLYLRYLCMT